MASRYNGETWGSFVTLLDLVTGTSGGTIGTFLTPPRRLTCASDGGRRRQAFRFPTRIHEDPLGRLLSNQVQRQEFGSKPLPPQALSARLFRVHSRAVKKASSRIAWWRVQENRHLGGYFLRVTESFSG